MHNDVTKLQLRYLLTNIGVYNIPSILNMNYPFNALFREIFWHMTYVAVHVLFSDLGQVTEKSGRRMSVVDIACGCAMR